MDGWLYACHYTFDILRQVKIGGMLPRSDNSCIVSISSCIIAGIVLYLCVTHYNVYDKASSETSIQGI